MKTVNSDENYDPDENVEGSPYGLYVLTYQLTNVRRQPRILNLNIYV